MHLSASPSTAILHQIKRTSEWNKASEELKRYQELHEKYKDKAEFLTDMYGDPFDGEKVTFTLKFREFVAVQIFHRDFQS